MQWKKGTKSFKFKKRCSSGFPSFLVWPITKNIWVGVNLIFTERLCQHYDCPKASCNCNTENITASPFCTVIYCIFKKIWSYRLIKSFNCHCEDRYNHGPKIFLLELKNMCHSVIFLLHFTKEKAAYGLEEFMYIQLIRDSLIAISSFHSYLYTYRGFASLYWIIGSCSDILSFLITSIWSASQCVRYVMWCLFFV